MTANEPFREPVRAIILDPGRPPREVALEVSAPAARPPFVSCIMATHGRIEPARHAIACFERQAHPHRELVIACATPGSEVAGYVAGRTGISIVEVPGAGTVGALRNAAIAAAIGSLLCVWDDDDLSHPQRLAWQVEALMAADAAACTLSRVLLWWPEQMRLAVSASRIWENSLLARRDSIGAYPDVARGGDTLLIEGLRATAPIVAIDRPTGYCYIAHNGNLWGQPHFEMLFDRATETYSGSGYATAFDHLSASLPLSDYAAGI